MKTANQTAETEHTSGTPIDPFAVDFFGGVTSLEDEAEPINEKIMRSRRTFRKPKKSDWHKKLPQISNSEAEISSLLRNLPEKLTDEAEKIIAETIARYSFQEKEKVHCSTVSVSETNLNRSLNSIAETPQIFLKLVCLPEKSAAIIALNTEFAAALIESLLRGNEAENKNSRRLSPIETTIIEFLAANILGEINNLVGEPILSLQSVKTGLKDLFEPFERGAEIVLNLESDKFNGIVSLFAPQKFLAGLDKTQNRLISKRAARKRLSDYEKFAGNLELHLQIGATFLDANSLLFLEPDDIVLIEQPQVNFRNENFDGNLQIFVGRGKNFRLSGNAESKEFNNGLQFRIEEILSEEARRKFTPAKFKMDEKENELAAETGFESAEQTTGETTEETIDEQIAPALENVQVALRVEIAGNKISLRELQNLHAGQIIALGCQPTDPVKLVTDQTDEPVASGELVEIEGQLGVRLTKVFI